MTDKIMIEAKGLEHLEKTLGLSFLGELSKKYPNIAEDEEQNKSFWLEIAKKKGFASVKEWLDSEN